MTHYKGNTRDKGSTRDGVKSGAASDLTDKRGGAQDKIAPSSAKAKTPEGLKRERKGPYGPTTGRSGAGVRRGH